ncbi:MFS transporter [Paenibacillus sp. YPG26]|uniref:MFS transporter n=1 Tax=Paenibacillus sp. YPG26 TaxID=2878915 RepID=UPI00204119D7|nr:MFS transporter [Paenibacillus sp. YPG26]USB32559.1 MFS transporter [Paenibacillus sp. YPG26]
MKIAFWLYFFMFIAFFDLHAQYPILTPFALSLGAAPTFIGWMMGIYSITHLPGNLLAGRGVDRHGSRRYLIFSLISAGIILLIQAQVTAPWQLLVLRSLSGFVLAFLAPACLALLASLSDDRIKQGKLMAGHGVMHTLASVVSPAAGAFLVAKAGFGLTFQSLGWLLIGTGIIAFFIVHDRQGSSPELAHPVIHASSKEYSGFRVIPMRFYMLPLFVACAQGILFFELPLQAGGLSGILDTGIYFSLLSLGALVTLCMLFLHKYSPYVRATAGVLGMALAFYSMASAWNVPLAVSLFFLGMSKGVLYPAMASLFIELSGGKRLGTVFSLQSISMSLGAFLGPVVAGQIRHVFSPYFLAFLLLMILLITVPPLRTRSDSASGTSKTPTTVV